MDLCKSFYQYSVHEIYTICKTKNERQRKNNNIFIL